MLRRFFAGPVLFSLLISPAAPAQQKSPAPAATTAPPWTDLAFLQGTWSADARTPNGASVHGTYSFQLELNGTVMARHSRTSDCKSANALDCEHGDLLYLYNESGAHRAIYFDSEGHVIHYAVNVLRPGEAVFVSEATGGPRFRLSYELRAGTMTGRFEMQPPGKQGWLPYLQWTGTRQ